MKIKILTTICLMGCVFFGYQYFNLKSAFEISCKQLEEEKEKVTLMSFINKQFENKVNDLEKSLLMASIGESELAEENRKLKRKISLYENDVEEVEKKSSD